MNGPVREGEFEIDFGDGSAVLKLDDPARTRPEGLRWVDFVIEEDDRIILLEIKDPSSKPKGKSEKAMAAIRKQREEFRRKITNDALIHHELTPKARDSYTYLHLMARDTKPLLYVFLLGAKKLALDDALLVAFKDRLDHRLRQEADEPWARPYVRDCMVLTEKSWSGAFPNYSLRRIQ